MAITRTAWIDDDGSGTTGTVINNAEKTLLYDQIDAALVTTAASSEHRWTEVTTNAVGVQNDFNPGIVGDTIIRCGNPSLLTITGLATSAAKTPGQRVRFLAIGSQIDLCYYDSRSLTANRLVNYASSAPTSLAPGTTPTRAYAEYQWSSPDGQWILREHEQGAWITPPYSAANFLTGGWTVEASDVSYNAYRLSGRTLTTNIYLTGTSLSAPATSLLTKIPAGYTYAGGAYSMGSAAILDGAKTIVSEVYASPGDPTNLTIRPLDGTVTIAAGTNAMTIKWSGFTIPVT